MTIANVFNWTVVGEEEDEAASEESDTNLPFPGAAAPFKKKSIASDLNWAINRVCGS